MKRISKASSNNQSIKRFLTPQPSNIPCKKPRKTGIKIGPKSRVSGSSIAIQNDENFNTEMERMKTNNDNIMAAEKEAQNSIAPCSPQDKFNLSSFVQDPGELNESRYPVTLNTFKTMTHSISIVKRILEDIKIATGINFLNDQLIQERVLKNYYIQFYEQPQIRDMYKLETKACPVFVKKKIMQIPKLADGTGDSAQRSNEAEHVQSFVRVEQANKQKQLQVAEAQSTKEQSIALPQQSNSPVQSIGRKNIFLSKKTVFAESHFLLTHIRRHVQQVEKHQTILDRIKSAVLQQNKHTQEVRTAPKLTPVMSEEESVDELSDITVTSRSSAAVITATQRVQEAKELFFRDYDKSNTLAYALRFHKGVRRRIIDAILKMSLEEFKKYTKIHDAPEIYEDDDLLGGYYNYAIKEPKIWPINLYMCLSDLLQFLKLKGITICESNLEVVSPMLLHWSELAAKTNFDEIMHWDYYRCKGDKLKNTTPLDAYRKAFYEKCWLHNIWLRKTPKVSTLGAQNGSESIETEQANVNATLPEASNNNETSDTPTVVISDCSVDDRATAAAEKVPENGVKVEFDNDVDLSCQGAPGSTQHAGDERAEAEMQHLEESLETLNINNQVHETGSNGEITVAKQERESVLEATTSTQAAGATLVEMHTGLNLNSDTEGDATTTQAQVVNAEATLMEVTTDLDQNIDTTTNPRVQKAIDLYFAEVEKSCTLPYLLGFHSGLKRHIIATILKMSFAEFRQYTHIYDAAEIYNDLELLKRCYEYTMKMPQVWPINLYVRMTDIFQYFKSKGVTLPEFGLKYISPKLLDWHDLVSMTNYDYILIWDYYRCTGKKMNRSKTLLDPYRQTFYKKCWFYDKWPWYTPKIVPKVLRLLANDQNVPAEEEHNENAVFERSVVFHAVERGPETSGESVKGVETTNKHEKGDTVEYRRPRLVDAEIQTSQRLLGEHLSSAMQAYAGSDLRVIENPINIKEEKLVPLNKLQFNLTNDEDNYECVQAPEEVVDLDATLPTSQTQEQTLLPLSNSESLVVHDFNELLSGDLHNCPLGAEQCASEIMLGHASNELNLQQSGSSEESTNTETEIHQREQHAQSLQTSEPEQADTTQHTLEQPQTNSQPKPQSHQQQEPMIVEEPKQTQPQRTITDSTTAATNKQYSQPLQLQVSRDGEEVQQPQKIQHKPITQPLATDEAVRQTNTPQSTSVEPEPSLLQVKQERAKNSIKQQQSAIATAMSKIIELTKSARDKNRQPVKGQQKPLKQENMEVEQSLQQQKQPEQQKRKPLAQQQHAHKNQTPEQQQQQKQQEQQQHNQEQRQQTKITHQMPSQKAESRTQQVHQTVMPQQQQQQTSKCLSQNQPQILDSQTQHGLQTVEQQQEQHVLMKNPIEQQHFPVSHLTSNTQTQLAKSQSQQELQIAQQQQQQQQLMEKVAQSDQQQQHLAVQQISHPQSQLQYTQLCVQQQCPPQLQQDQAIEGQLQALLGDRMQNQLQQPQTPADQNQPTQVIFNYQESSQFSQPINQTLQQQATVEHANENERTEAYKKIEIISQQILQNTALQQQPQVQQQQQPTQPQLIFQRTHTQVQEQLMLQDVPRCVPPLVKLSKHSTTSFTTKTKTVKTAKPAATRKATKNSDYVPQLTHAFQPLPIALNTKKPSAYSAPTHVISLPTQSSQIPGNLQQNHLVPVVEEQVIAASNVALPAPNTNTLLLTLPAGISSSSSNSTSNSSYVYTLSGDSTFFNSSELLRAIEHYQLQRSQQHQQSQLQLQRQQLFEQQSPQLVLGQSQIVQLPQQQFEQLQQSQPQQQQLELYHQSQTEQQQHIQIPQPLVLEASSQQQPQQQQYPVLSHQQPLVYQLLDVSQASHGHGEQQQQQRQYTQLQGEQPNTQIEWTVPEDITSTQRLHPINPDLSLYPHYVTEITQENFIDAHKHSKTTLSASKAYPHYTIEMLQVNVRAEHNYSKAPSAPVVLSPLPSPKGTCRMRPQPRLKPFLFRKLEKLDYFSEVSAENIANYQLQCTSIGQPYLQAQIRTLHLRTVVSGDLLTALLPRYHPALMQDLLLVLQYLGEFHYNAWEQQQLRKVISKSTHRTLHTLSAQALLLFFQYSSPFQSKTPNLEDNSRHFEPRNCLSAAAAATASELPVQPDDMLDDLSLAIDPSILEQMAELKRNL